MIKIKLIFALKISTYFSKLLPMIVQWYNIKLDYDFFFDEC